MKVAKSTISPQWHTVIPVGARPWLKAEQGDELEWHVEDGRVYVVKKEPEGGIKI